MVNNVQQQKMSFGMSEWRGLENLKQYSVTADALKAIKRYAKEEAPNDGHDIVLSKPRFPFVDIARYMLSSTGAFFKEIFERRENHPAKKLRNLIQFDAARQGKGNKKPSVTVTTFYNPNDPTAAFKEMAKKASAELEEREQRAKVFTKA